MAFEGVFGHAAPDGSRYFPQYIAEYLEEIAKVATCPLDKIFMVCYGLDMDGIIHRISSSVLSALLCSMAFRLMDGN